MWNKLFKDLQKIYCVVGIKAKNDKLILKYGNDDSYFANNINKATMLVEKILRKYNINFSYVYCHSENLVYRINNIKNLEKFEDKYNSWNFFN